MVILRKERTAPAASVGNWRIDGVLSATTGGAIFEASIGGDKGTETLWAAFWAVKLIFGAATSAYLRVDSGVLVFAAYGFHRDGNCAFLLVSVAAVRQIKDAASEVGEQYGLWLSLVERFVRDEEAAGSNPASPIDSHSSSCS